MLSLMSINNIPHILLQGDENQSCLFLKKVDNHQIYLFHRWKILTGSKKFEIGLIIQDFF